MESPQAEITRYTINSRVVGLEEHFVPAYVIGSGVGKEAQFVSKSHGWFLFLEGSYEALHVGFEKPAFEKGDAVKITLEKINV